MLFSVLAHRPSDRDVKIAAESRDILRIGTGIVGQPWGQRQGCGGVGRGELGAIRSRHSSPRSGP